MEPTNENTDKTQNQFLEKPLKEYHFLDARSERIVVIALLILISTAPIIFGKSIPSHADWHIHMERAYNFTRCFWQGQWVPRWIDAQAAGYGLPVFNFYAPLVYYIYTLLDLIFRNAVLAIKWTFVIPVILSSLFGYLYLRKHCSPAAVTVALGFIVFSPAIHMYIYNDNWPGSVLAIPFVFLILYGIDSFNKEKDFDLKTFLIISGGYATLIVTHIASAFCFTLLAIPYFFLSLNIYRTKKFLKNYILSFLMGGTLGAFYLLPAALEKKLVHADEVLVQGPLWDYSKNFLFTFLDRNKDEGYAWAVFDHRYYEVSNALFGLAVLLCAILLILNMDKVKKYFSEHFRVVITITMFTITFLMMTPVSLFAWIMIKPLHTIQFPWRFTTFIVPFGALIIAYAFDLVMHLGKEKINTSNYKFVLFSVAFLFGLLLYVNYINMFKWPWVPEQSLLKSAVNVLWANEEYRSRFPNDLNWKSFDPKRDFSPSIQSTNIDTNITLVDWKSHLRSFEVFSSTGHEIALRTFYFPGWNVYIDEKKSDIRLQNPGKFVFYVPAGKHQIIARFEDTSIRKTSFYISLIALLIYLYYLSEYFSKKKVQVKEKEKEVLIS